MPKLVAENADATLLKQIREANAGAGNQFLEYLVMQKRSTDPSLHTQLVQLYVEELMVFLKTESVAEAFKSAISAYIATPRSVPFLAHVAFNTPDTEFKRVRIKLCLFMQGSQLFDVSALKTNLQPWQELLPLEMAILDGKLGNHREALLILVHTLRDSLSAEAYCSLNGNIIPPRIATAVAERVGLQVMGALLAGGSEGSSAERARARRASLRTPKTEGGGSEVNEEEEKKKLLKILMEVYMSAGDDAAEQTAKLLNAQAIHLDIVDVLSVVPSSWPLKHLSSFLARSLRRSLHARHEGMIIKAISAGQNLEASDEAYAYTLSQGALVEEPVEGEESGAAAEVIEEKVVEKTPELDDQKTVDIHPSEVEDETLA